MRRQSSIRKPLPIDALLEPDAALIEAFGAITALRRRSPAAALVQYPPLPSPFSESLVIQAAPRLFGAEWRASYGNDCDLLLQTDSGLRKRVEVKATGRRAFQELKAKDLKADFLVWVRFGRRYELGNGPIEISVLENPGRYIRQPCRLDTTRFERIDGVAANQRVITFNSLADLLCEQQASARHGTSLTAVLSDPAFPDLGRDQTGPVV
jgi:hypothetical protein